MTFKHVIFDCDGTLVDSEPISMRADVELLARFGIHMGVEEAGARFIGKTFEAMLDEMTAEHGVTFPPGLHEEKNTRVAALYETELRMVPHLRETLDELRARGITCSVGSNSPKSRVELTLKLMRLTNDFTHVVTFEDVANGKPAPDIFLRAAELSGCHPSQCLVIEDSETGVRAAVAGGLAVAGYVGTHHDPARHGEKLRKLGAAWIIDDIQHAIALTE